MEAGVIAPAFIHSSADAGRTRRCGFCVAITAASGNPGRAMTSPWTPSIWRELPAGQQPEWPDEAALEAVLKRLSSLPPLVFAGEPRQLTSDLADVQAGN